MDTPEIIFLGLVAAILLVGFAWTFAAPNDHFVPFWIERTGRRASATGPAGMNAGDDRSDSEPDASNR
jgi:hypothetical protein